ncbi:MAG: site-specific tyrosine recombinase XerD, partial [Gammaproteobacteria bacterium]
MRSDDDIVITRFTDALWLEDGLGEKTRQAYRSDLLRLSAWLESQPGKPVLAAARRTD